MKRASSFIILVVLFGGAIVLYWIDPDVTVREEPSATSGTVSTTTIGYGPKAVVGGKSFDLLVANTEESRSRGLGDRETLDPDKAMIFIFPDKGYWGIWMKDMIFPIDILWLDEDLKIVSIEKDVWPDSFPKSFLPESEAKYVIEFNAGVIDDVGAKIGDQAEIVFP